MRDLNKISLICREADLKNTGGKNRMEFLKELVSEETYNALVKELEGKKVKIVNLESGEYVSKAKYDGQVTTVKNLQKEIEDLKATIPDDQTEALNDLQKKYDEDIEILKQENAKDKINSQVAIAIAKSNAIDDVAIKAHLKEFLKDANVDDSGNVVGLDEQLNNLKESNGYLFEIGGSSGKTNKHEVGAKEPTNLNEALQEEYKGN